MNSIVLLSLDFVKRLKRNKSLKMAVQNKCVSEERMI